HGSLTRCVNYTTCLLSIAFAFLFFFQAEDGIRDRNVTGVQTCALPICEVRNARGRAVKSQTHLTTVDGLRIVRTRGGQGVTHDRSEERRVGKECRSRGWACQ